MSPDLCCHMASLGLNELNIWYPTFSTSPLTWLIFSFHWSPCGSALPSLSLSSFLSFPLSFPSLSLEVCEFLPLPNSVFSMKIRVRSAFSGCCVHRYNSTNRNATRRVRPSSGRKKKRIININSLRAEFFRGNINIYLYFVSFLHIDMTQVLKILPQEWEGPTYSI